MANSIFKIFNNSGYSRMVEPNGDFKIKGKLQKGEFYFNKSFQTLRLRGDDYKDLMQFENSFDSFFFEVKCSDNILFMGRFTFLNASICKEDCYIDLDIEEDSKIRCLRENDQEINIIATTIETNCANITVPINQMVFEMRLCPKLRRVGVVDGVQVVLPEEDDLPDNLCKPSLIDGDWGLFIESEFNVLQLTLSGGTTTGEFFLSTVFCVQIWARQLTTVPCTGPNVPSIPPNASLISGNCSIPGGTVTYSQPFSGSPINVVWSDLIAGTNGFRVVNNGFGINNGNPTNLPNCQDDGLWNFQNSEILDVFLSQPSTIGGFNTVEMCFYINEDVESIDAGVELCESRRLDDIIEEMLANNNCGVGCFDSKFFKNSINPVTGQTSKTNNLLITEMSDVTRPEADSSARVLNLSLFDLYEDLKNTFNLVIRVNKECCLEIEHVSEIFTNKISLSEIGKVISSGCCYKVDKEKIPSSECWVWNEALNPDFIGNCINYTDSQGNSIGSEVEEIKLNDVSTDLNYIINAYDDPVLPVKNTDGYVITCLLYTSPSPRDATLSRMPSSA